MPINNSINKILNNLEKPRPQPAIIEEEMLLSVNKLVSDAIAVPEGDYVVWAIDSNTDMCTLMPTAEDRFSPVEVSRPTLQGFYSPEVHRKVMFSSDGPIINEDGTQGPPRYLRAMKEWRKAKKEAFEKWWKENGPRKPEMEDDWGRDGIHYIP